MPPYYIRSRLLKSGIKVILFAESLGGVETLITFPETQTHNDIPEEIRARLGINIGYCVFLSASRPQTI